MNAPEAAAEWVPISALKPWENNPRVNERSVADVAASIKRFGFGAPILARHADGQVIAGGEPDKDGYKEPYGVIVICRDEGQQERTYNELTERGYECRVVTT
jgi:hypothetical protein